MKKDQMLEDIFLREKPAKILLGMKTSRESVYPTILSRESNCTYSHTIKILNMFKKMGIVKFEKTGRIKAVSLTEEGWDIAHNLEAIMKKFVSIQENAIEIEKRKTKKKLPMRK